MKLKIPGLSYSWKRVIGISSMRQRIARQTGIPTTRSGLERKIGTIILSSVIDILRGRFGK